MFNKYTKMHNGGIKLDLSGPLIAGKYKWQTCAFIFISIDPITVFLFLLLFLFFKIWQVIILLFYSFFAWRTHYRTLSPLPSSIHWRCLSRLYMICFKKRFDNIFLLSVSHCISPCVCFLFLIIIHLQWISSVIFSFRLSVWFPYGLRMRKIGVNVHLLTVWKIFW